MKMDFPSVPPPHLWLKFYAIAVLSGALIAAGAGLLRQRTRSAVARHILGLIAVGAYGWLALLGFVQVAPHEHERIAWIYGEPGLSYAIDGVLALTTWLLLAFVWRRTWKRGGGLQPAASSKIGTG